jgi:hypothetical protein
MAGAELLLLESDHAARGKRALHLRVPVPQHDDGPPGTESLSRGQHMNQHGTTAYFVQDLGQPGLHALALAGSQDDDSRDV